MKFVEELNVLRYYKPFIDAPFQFRPDEGGSRAWEARGYPSRGSGRVGHLAPSSSARHGQLGRALRPRPRRHAAEPALPPGPAGARLHEEVRILLL